MRRRQDAAMPRSAPGIALFDLDYTLLGGDATYEWIHFLIRRGVLDRETFAGELERFYDEYADGTLDIHEFLHFDFRPLASHPRAQLEQWRERVPGGGRRADDPAEVRRAGRVARGARARDDDHHGGQQLRQHADREDVRRLAPARRASLNPGTANSPGRSKGSRASTTERSSVSRPGSRIAGRR